MNIPFCFCRSCFKVHCSTELTQYLVVLMEHWNIQTFLIIWYFHIFIQCILIKSTLSVHHCLTLPWPPTHQFFLLTLHVPFYSFSILSMWLDKESSASAWAFYLCKQLKKSGSVSPSIHQLPTPSQFWVGINCPSAIHAGILPGLIL